MRFIIALVATIANCTSALELETKTEAKVSDFTPISMIDMGVPTTQDTGYDTLSDAQNFTSAADTVIAQPLQVNGQERAPES